MFVLHAIFLTAGILIFVIGVGFLFRYLAIMIRGSAIGWWGVLYLVALGAMMFVVGGIIILRYTPQVITFQ